LAFGIGIGNGIDWCCAIMHHSISNCAIGGSDIGVDIVRTKGKVK
jgi:hypothetical protein